MRYSKFQMNLWLDGEEHWLLAGKDYFDWEAPEDVVRKLRNAAWYRGIVAQIRVYPDRIWIQASEPPPGEKAPRPYTNLLEMYRLLEAKYNTLHGKQSVMEQDIRDLISRIRKIEEE